MLSKPHHCPERNGERVHVVGDPESKCDIEREVSLVGDTRFGDGAQWQRITGVLEALPKETRARWLRALCILYDVAP